ncbi:hypothetical protein FE257_006595 [Aspergillus nanangensis]|uniref:Uncharacterized protein n=1 Tax=Aspergillus nanangensis TaxID=2582783 RepID=A0AAD4CXT5_ASPNN|nr:hypothetical protein FE257_006595 [Aspergillus nanangensis]
MEPANLCKKCGGPRNHPDFVDNQTGLCYSCSETNSPVLDWRDQPETQQGAQIQPSFPAMPSNTPDTQLELIPETQSNQPIPPPLTVDIPSSQTMNNTTSASSAKVKLTAACSNCKKAKIRCVHRQPIDDGGKILGHRESIPIALPAKNKPPKPLLTINMPAPPTKSALKKRKREEDTTFNPEAEKSDDGPAAKRPLRIRFKQSTPEEVPETQPQPQPQNQGETKSRGRPRKRKAEDTTDEGNANPKPAKRGRKPKDTTSTAAATSSGSKDEGAKKAKASATKKLKLRFPEAMGDSLQGAALLAVHATFAKELEEQIEECETHFSNAMKSFKQIKKTVDVWIDTWAKAKK